MNKLIYVGVLLLAVINFEAKAQEADDDLFDLSLEDLMNVEIVSASKKAENVFDAPSSSYSITRRDIEISGATSIMEALRLSPGLIVREHTNGNYDVHIRGFDNILQYTDGSNQNSQSALVMIDNRPVFNPNLGGTYWETLPVDLNDVERIEIVMGPSAALFGPNAVTGVINIITRDLGKKKSMVRGDVQYGTPGSTIANLAMGTKIGSKTDVMISGNYQQRERFTEEYFDKASNQYVGSIEEVNEGKEAQYYDDPSKSLEKWGANVFIDHKISDKSSIGLDLGAQSAAAQKNYLPTGSFHTPTETTSQYANLHADINGFSFRASLNNGVDDINKVTDGLMYKYDFTYADVVAEYTWTVSDKLSIRPGLNYQSAKFDDSKYLDPYIGVFNKEVSNNSFAGSLRMDYSPIEPLRLVGAVRVDQFSSAPDNYLSYQFASTYKFGKSLVRANISRSNSGSFLGHAFLDIPLNPPFIGNTELKLFTVNMIEFGFRSNITDNLQLDVEIFNQKAENFIATATTDGSSISYQDMPTTANQIGTTLALNYVPVSNLQIKPFITIQKTETEAIITTAAGDVALVLGTPTIDAEHLSSPKVYGGFNANYSVNKFNIGLNSYFFGSHTQHNISEIIGQPENDLGDISGKFILNAKVAYSVSEKLNIFFNARNLFGSESREFYGTDITGAGYYGGVAFKL